MINIYASDSFVLLILFTKSLGALLPSSEQEIMPTVSTNTVLLANAIRQNKVVTGYILERSRTTFLFTDTMIVLATQKFNGKLLESSKNI